MELKIGKLVDAISEGGSARALAGRTSAPRSAADRTRERYQPSRPAAAGTDPSGPSATLPTKGLDLREGLTDPSRNAESAALVRSLIEAIILMPRALLHIIGSYHLRRANRNKLSG